MDYVRMGNSGLKLTKITFGTALTIGTESRDVQYAFSLVDMAWSLGIRSFDTSNNYGYGEAERMLGQALKKYSRHEYVLATKGSWPIGDTPYDRGLSRKHILWAIDQSLKNLDADYVDIYYAHRYDPDTPMEEVARTFNSLIASGKIRYWATSEWPEHALRECHETCERLRLEKPVIEQCIYSFAVKKVETNGVKQFCDSHGVGMMGFSPLCQGILTGKYRNSIPDNSRIAKAAQINYSKTRAFYEQNQDRIERYFSVCDQYGIRPVDAAIQWGVRHGIYPVLGASKPSQLEDTLANLNVSYGEEFWKELEEI